MNRLNPAVALVASLATTTPIAQRLSGRAVGRLSLLLLLATFFATAPSPSHAEIVFTNVADTSTSAPLGNFSEFGGPALNGGTVAFDAYYNGQIGNPNIRSGIFAYSGGALTTVVKQGDPAPSGTWTSFGNAAAQAGSKAVFSGIYDGNAKIGIYQGSGGALTPVVDYGDPAPTGEFLLFQSPTARGNTVAFQGTSTGGVGIFATSGGPVTKIAAEGDAAPVGTFSGFGLHAGIDGSSIAFMGSYANESASGIFIGDGVALTTVAKTGDVGPLGAFTKFDWPSLDGGTAAFRAFSNGGQAILTGSGGPLTTIAKTGDAVPGGIIDSFLFAQNGVSISGNLVVFQASYGIDQSGVFFTQGGGAPQRLLGDGDALFGSTVSSVDIGLFGAEDHQIAFRYILHDGRRGIGIATVPEPSSLLLATLAIAALLARVRHNRARQSRAL